MTLNDLIFENCVIVGFSRDAARESLTLTFEAHDAKAPTDTPDLYILECTNISDVQLRFGPEFPADLNRPYTPGGKDQRANEIYELRRDATGAIHIRADMIEGSFRCPEFRLLRVVEEVEANA
ncbi:hypothetical protein FBQ87_12400 [Sphingobacteriales bacterium CHB3]|nr:hypothetical protein [Sphingobacteriales bacterium CHB3]